MYGMIHQAVRAMVIDELGEEEWSSIERKLGIGPSELISQSVYEDSLTFGLIASSSESLAVPINDCLERFGKYWIRFAERGSYGAIMDFTGRTFVDFIENLDRMHQAVIAAMPEAKVPSFSVVVQEEGRLLIKYQSERSGLEPFVVGLLRGLLVRFGLAGEVEPVSGLTNYSEFLVTYRDA